MSHRLLVALAAAVSVWAVAAFYFDIQIAWLRVPAACLYSIVVVSLVWFTRGSYRGIAIWLASLVAVIIGWLSLAPTNNRRWQPDVAELAWTERNGNLVTIHNVRDFSYRTELDYNQIWETQDGEPLATHGREAEVFGLAS